MKFTVAGLCALALIAACYWGIYPQANAYGHWHQAQKEVAQLDFNSARRDLEACLAVWPDSGQTHFQLARICRRQGDIEAARAQLREAKRLKWVPEQVQLEYLLLQAQTGAVPAVEKGLKLLLGNGHPDEPLIFEALVRGCLESRFLTKAGLWATAWVKRHPDDWHAHWWNAQAQDELDNSALALKNYKEVVTAAPFFTDAHLALGYALFHEGRLKEALAQFKEVVRKQPDGANGLFGLAQCQRDLSGMTEDAIGNLDHLLALYPDHVRALLLRGQLELDADRPDASLAYFRKAGELAPGDRGVIHALTTVYSRLHDTAAADRYEKRYRELEALNRRLGHILTQTRTDDHNADLRAEAGDIYLQMNQPADALHWLISALLIDRDNPRARQDLKKCLGELGDPKLVAQARALLTEKPTISIANP